VSFDPYAPYGPVVRSSVRIATWNVWGRYGDWQQRQAGIEDELLNIQPDVVCLVEAWRQGDDTQAERVAGRLGFSEQCFVGDFEQEDWISGIGLVSRWPMTAPERQPLRGEDGRGFGEAVHVVVEGERGPVQLFAAVLDYPLNGSSRRLAQVRELGRFIQDVGRPQDPIVVCGDFNAGPDSDEIRALTGRTATVVPGLVFYDSWEIAGDGGPGYTWSNRNPLAAVGLYPDRRFDYIFSAWPRLGGAGHPTRCELIGVRPPDQPQLSDHYGVVAELRY
jgi:endonuclease/exonuclease/phosphatase family metal-dependent hydrolase